MDATAAAAAQRRILTIPNVITVARLLCVPWFLWLLLVADNLVGAGVLLAVLGATDWIDGYIARHFDQGSELGKVLDPVADRILLGAAVVGLLLSETAPVWLCVAILLREVGISLVVVALAVAGARHLVEVHWVGKAGALALMFGLPAFLAAGALDPGDGLRTLLLVYAWACTLPGLVLSYYAAFTYVPDARRAIQELRGVPPAPASTEDSEELHPS